MTRTVRAGRRGRAYNNLLSDWRAFCQGRASADQVALFYQAERGLGLHPRVKLAALAHSSVARCADELGLSPEQLGEDHPNARTLEVIGKWIWMHYGIDPDAFWDTLIDGDRAVEDFDTWIRAGRLPLRTQIDLLPQSPFETSPEREARLRETISFIVQPTLKPILTITGDGMSEGLRAFAARLVNDLQADGDTRPIVYIPAGRDPKTNDKVSYPQLVAYLRAFYLRQPLGKSPPSHTAEGLRLDIETIRSGMTKQASIIILDGWSGFTGGLARLGSAMIDDGLVSLIEEIIHPCWGPRAGETDPIEFTRNRILVLAATQSQISDAFSTPGIKSLPPPESGAPMARIARVQHRSAVMEALAPHMVHERTDVSLAMMEFLTNGLDVDTAEPLRATLLGGEKTLAPAVLQRLEASPLAYLVMALAVLMPDGIRLMTIDRIARAWSLAQERSPVEGPWPNTPIAPEAKIESEIEEAVALLAPLLSLGQDSTIEGLDDRDYPRERLDFAADLSPLNPDHRYLDFTAPRLRPVLAMALTSEVYQRPAIARLHRLLAEDMLAQYNRIARHGDWRDANDLRFYRRLIQALYHGFSSLALGPAYVDDGLKALTAAALPTDPTVAYLRLYTVHYRALLEAPPDWNLSRVMGRDDIKVDLIKLMLNLDGPRPWANLAHRETLQVRTPAFLRTSVRRVANSAAMRQGQRAIFADQMTSLAKAALRNNDLTSCRAALDVGLDFVEQWNTSATETHDTDDAALARATHLTLVKTAIDYAVVSSDSGRLEHALADARHYLVETFGFRREWLEILESAQLDASFFDRENNRKFADEVRNLLDTFTDAVGEQGPNSLSTWSDLMGLIAEIHVLSGEHRDTPTEERAQEILRAYFLLAAGDRLRRMAFEAAPLERDFHINTHSKRVLVRACLQLIKLGRRAGSTVPVDTTNFLVAQTRRQLDILSRYVARFPTEKPSLLILEAAFARQAGTSRAVDLVLAERLLSEADDLMRAVTHRPRVRLRLMRERAKVYRGLAGIETEPQIKQAYVDLAYLEIRRLDLLADKARLELWKSIATAQKLKMDRFVEDIGLLPSEAVRRLI